MCSSCERYGFPSCDQDYAGYYDEHEEVEDPYFEILEYCREVRFTLDNALLPDISNIILGYIPQDEDDE